MVEIESCKISTIDSKKLREVKSESKKGEKWEKKKFVRRDGWIAPYSNPINRIIILWPFCKPQIPRSEYIVTVESCSVH